MQGHGRIIAHNFCVAHREANSGLSTLNHTKSILSIYHQQRQLQKQRGMCLNDTYPFCQQPLSSNCHSICFSKPVLWAATPGWRFSPLIRIVTVYPKICSVIVIGISPTSSRRCDQPPAVRAAPDCILPSSAYSVKKTALLHENPLYCMRAPCPQRTGNEDRVLTHAVTHEQKNRGGNNGEKRICG